jgi:hypothetical protein
MAEHQTDLRLDVGYDPAPAVVSELREEIATAWGLPLGQRVEVSVKKARCAMARLPTIGVQVEAPAVRYDALDALVKIGKSGAADVLGLIKEREKTADPHLEKGIRRAISRLEPRVQA